MASALHVHALESHLAGNRLRHHLSAWLALFAMLLVLIAPVISQSLALNHAPTNDISLLSHHQEFRQPFNTAGHEHNHEHGEGALHSINEAPSPAKHSDHGFAKCGYCTLMVKSPVLTGFSCCFQNVAGSEIEPAPPESKNSRPIKAVFPNALSRAPPSFTDNKDYPRGT
jgi:hypothetical protein